MQKQTSNQKDFVDKELLDTLKKSYYFYLEEKFRLHQRASFLFILLVPMFAILFQLSKTYDNPQILEFFFIALLTITLFFSVIFLSMSFVLSKFNYISPIKTVQYYNKNRNKLIKKLAIAYAKTSNKNKNIVKKRAIYLWLAYLFVTIFGIILLIFFVYIFIKNGYYGRYDIFL